MIENMLLALIGLAAGVFVAAGVFAFMVMIGVVTRMVARTKTVKYLWLYEDMIVLGGGIGSLLMIYRPQLPIGGWILALFGLFSGIYAGSLALALAEIVNSIPVLTHRLHMKTGLWALVTVFALGKGFGALWQLWVNR